MAIANVPMKCLNLISRRWGGTRSYPSIFKKMTEFRKGPFSALRPLDAPQPPAILPAPAKVRLAQSDAKEAISAKYLIILQNISISSKALHSLKLKVKELAGFTIKMIPPAILTETLINSSADDKIRKIKLEEYPALSWISGPTFVAYTNETDSIRLHNAILALKSEPFIVLLGCRFENTFFTHEGLNDLLRNLPCKKEPLLIELVTLLNQSQNTLTHLLSSPSFALASLIESRRAQLDSNETFI